MKWNWGTKLVLAMAAFMSMLIIFAVLMMREEVPLVERTYYPKGQAFQETIVKRNRAKAFNDSIVATQQGSEIILRFPKLFCPDSISGSVHLYNRMTENGDRLFALQADVQGQFVFPKDGLNGRSILSSVWQYDNIVYYTEKSLTWLP